MVGPEDDLDIPDWLARAQRKVTTGQDPFVPGGELSVAQTLEIAPTVIEVKAFEPIQVDLPLLRLAFDILIQEFETNLGLDTLAQSERLFAIMVMLSNGMTPEQILAEMLEIVETESETELPPETP